MQDKFMAALRRNATSADEVSALRRGMRGRSYARPRLGCFSLCVRFVERQANWLYFCVSAGDQLRGERPCSSDCSNGADCHAAC